MTSRSLKLLTASTAFVAAASAGYADTVSTTVTTTRHTSDSVAGFTVTGTGTISVSTGVGIAVSSTSSASNTINIQSGGVVAGQTAAIIGAGDPSSSTGAVTINNSGTIANFNNGSGRAVYMAGMTNGVTLNNAGTISGTITFGDGTNVMTSTGTTSGTITGGTGADTLTFTGANHTAGITLGAGTNSLTVSNSTVSGTYTGGANDDTVSVKDGSTFRGNIAMGAGGTDTVTVSNATVIGDIGNGAGSTMGVTLTNAIVSGTITDNNGTGDALTINGSNTFTTRGVISGFEAMNFNTNTVLDHAVTGGTTAATTVAAGKTLSVNADYTTTGGAITNNGQINIAAGKTATAATMANGAGSGLGIAINSSNTTTGVGKLVLSAGGTANGTSLTINMGLNSGYIASGTQYTIVDGAATSSATLLNTNAGVYRYSVSATTASTGQDLVLTVGRVSTSSVATGSDNKAVADVLDRIGANVSTTSAINTVQSLVGQQSTAAGVDNVLESLTPSIDGAGMASVNVTVDTGNQISNRLASLRGTSGVATGDPMANKHMWVQGFGSTVEQDDKGGNSGYDASAGGMSIGVDTDTLVDGMTTGLTLSYARGSVDSNASSNASTDIDTYVGTLYGSRTLDGGVFLNGQLGLGYNKYDMERTVLGVGRATGDTNGWQGTAKLEGGKDFAAGGFTVTPLASLQYTYVDIDSYTETGAGGVSLKVNPESLSTVDAGAGAQVAYAIPLSDGGTLKPSLRAKYVYRMGDESMGTTSQFVGGGAAFNTNGVKSDRSSVNLGAGLLLTTIGGTDLSLNYDADIRSSLTGHTGQLKARWAF